MKKYPLLDKELNRSKKLRLLQAVGGLMILIMLGSAAWMLFAFSWVVLSIFTTSLSLVFVIARFEFKEIGSIIERIKKK